MTVNCLHPGAVATNVMEKDPDFPLFSRFLYKLVKPFFASPEKGGLVLGLYIFDYRCHKILLLFL